MKKLAITLLLVNLAVLAASLPWLPEPVAVHFDGQGRPNGWMSQTVHALFMGLFILLMTGLFLALPALTGSRMDRWLNIPQRDRWLSPSHRPRLEALLAGFGHRCAVLMGLFLLGIQGLLVLANQTSPARLNNTLTIILMVAFVVLILAASLQLTWQLRHPDRH